MLVDSEINVPNICKISLLPPNYAGIVGSHRVEIAPSNSLKNAKKMNFQLPPTLPSELYGPESELIFSLKLKKDGGEYAETDQISCVNFLAILIFETVKVLVAGEEAFENERYSAHLLFLRLMLDYTPEWREINLFGAGFREDTEGNACEYCVLDIRYWVLGICVLGIGYWVLDIGYWVLGKGYWAIGIGYLGNGYWVLGNGYLVLGIGIVYWVLGIGYCVIVLEIMLKFKHQ